MITLDIEQGIPEWFAARAGRPSASCFGKILTPTGQPSDQQEKYLNALAGDWLMGGALDSDDFRGYWMDRGNRLEPEARDTYSFITDNPVDQVGFVYLDVLRRVGGSPDGLIGEDGGLEIKCPKKETHVANLRNQEMPACYIPQVQGCMWITGRKWWDFMSYHPQMPPMIKRIERDNAYISKLEKAVSKFLLDLSDVKLQLEEYKT